MAISCPTQSSSTKPLVSGPVATMMFGRNGGLEPAFR